MDLSSKPFSLLSVTLIFFIRFGLFLPSVGTISADYSTLVYKDCANQTFTDPIWSSSQALSSLFQDLVTQSSQSKFFKTTAGDDQTAIFGLFQCRGDLSDDDCNNCVSALPEMSNSLCSKSIAARIQLSGCYALYCTDGFPEDSEFKLLYKICGESNAVASGFEELRNKAFAALESGVVSGNGFYTTSYESVHVMAQCEEDLGSCDCGECVHNAVQTAQEECGSSVSGQIYLYKCFLSYTYYPNGKSDDSYPEKGKGNNNTGKSIAIFVGGAAALCLGLIFFMFMKSLVKKRWLYYLVQIREKEKTSFRV